MTSLLVAPEGIFFSAALLLMLAIGLIEAIGLGASGWGVDLGADLDHGPLGWLGIGQVPLLILLVTFLAVFGAVGLAGQHIAQLLTGAPLAPLVAVPAALVAALPVTSFASRGLARIMPRDESSAIDVEDLVGRTATITLGRAAKGSPARARVVDVHGQTHHVLAEPDNSGAVFEAGDEILLVRRDGNHFRAIFYDRPSLSDWSVS